MVRSKKWSSWRGIDRFELKALWLEPGVRPSERLVRDLVAMVLRCARWHGCAEVTLAQTAPASLAPPLRAALAHSTFSDG